MRALSILVLAFTLAPCAAQEIAGTQPPPQKRLTFTLRDVPLRKAVAQWTGITGAQVSIADDVPDVPITLNVRDVPADSALRIIVRMAQDQYAGIGIVRDGNRWMLRVLPVEQQPLANVAPEPPDPRLQQRITLNLQNETLARALERVMGRQPVTLEQTAELPSVRLTMKLENVTTFEALLRVVQAAKRQAPELRFTRDHGTYRVEAEVRPAPNPQPLEQLRARKITASFKATPFREAVATVFRGSGLQYTLNPNVPNLPVSAELKDVTLESAVQTLVRELADRAPGLELSQSGDIFILERRGPRAAE